MRIIWKYPSSLNGFSLQKYAVFVIRFHQ